MTTRPEKCGIPQTSSTPCDQPWGHAGEYHSFEGFKFRVRDFDEEHLRRQKETGNAPKPTFHFSISADVSLDVDQIWPDGDAPENPTVDDVAEVIKKCGGKMRVIEDWDLDDDLDLTISDSKATRNIP